MMKEHQYYDLSLCDIFEDLSSGVVSLDSSPITFSSSLDLAFDDSFQTELTNAFLPGPINKSFETIPSSNNKGYSENLFPELGDSISFPVLNVPSTPSTPLSAPSSPKDETTDDLMENSINRNYISTPSAIQQSLADSNSLYLRWSVSPPDRVHATSPSKLNQGSRCGTPFSFSVELVTKCSNGTFIPFSPSEDIQLVAHVYGKRKPKTGAKTVTNAKSKFVLLEENPIGKPLMVHESSSTPGVRSTIRKGETMATFDGVSLTCGSNAARSQNAPPAARVWDWDYHIRVDVVESEKIIEPLYSKHITTDSNRSQTREKRKREDSSVALSSPPLKKKLFPLSLHGESFPAPKVFAPFKSDMYDFSSAISNY